MRSPLVIAGGIAIALIVGIIGGVVVGRSMPLEPDLPPRLAIEAPLKRLPWSAVRRNGHELRRPDEDCAALSDDGPDHATCWFFDLVDRRVAIAAAAGEGGPSVGVDRNNDGTIDGSEWSPAGDVAGKPAVVAELEVTVPGGAVLTEFLIRPSPDGQQARVTEQVVGGVAHLPEGLVALRASARKGWFGGENTKMWVDVSGDGRTQFGNYLETRFNGQLTPVGGTIYRISIASDGRRATFEPVAPDGELPFPGYPAPSFQVTDAAGRGHSLEGYDGHWLVLAFWASWCGPCRGDRNALDRLKETHPNLRILGIATDDSSVTSRRALRGKPYAGSMVLHPDARSMAEAYEIHMLPANVLIDPDGVVRAVGDAHAVMWALETGDVD